MKKIVIDKDLLYKVYVEENHNIKETTDILNDEHNLNVSQRTVQRQIKEYSFNKDQNQIAKTRESTNMKLYGVKNAYQSEEIKEKCKQTKLEKYGDENYNNCKKHTNTLIEKYGVSSPALLEKSKITLMKNYGVTSPMKSDLIKDKVKETNMKKYGVPFFVMTEEYKLSNGFTISKINQRFSELLSKNNIEHELEFNISCKSFDFHILNTNILLEINPTYTHNSTNSCWFNNYEKPPISSDYHFNKSKLAKENGYHCIHIFDWDDIDKIINILKPKEAIPARKCEVKDVSKEDCKAFEMKNHLQGYCNHQDIRLGLYYNNELVQLMTFGKPRYNKNYEYELIRLCSSESYAIIGGSEKLFKYFIEKYSPSSIISYCDDAKFNGNVYSKLGFEMKSYGSPSKHWWNGERHITDNLLRQQGFDRLFNASYGKGTSNEQLMLEHGFVEIYDCGQSTYVWRNINE